MPHTHPQYRTAIRWPDNDQLTDGPSCYSPPSGTLHDVLVDCARMNAVATTSGTYFPQPVPGTEPRYLMHVSGPNGRGAMKAWPYGPQGGYTWPQVCAAYSRKVRLSAEGCTWPLTYRVVQA